MFAKGPTVWLMLEPLWDRKPGEAQSVGPGPREGPGKAYVGAGIYACGSIEGRAWSLRLQGLSSGPNQGPNQAQSPGTYELDIRQGPAKPRPGLDLGQGLGPGFTRVLPLGPGQGPSSGPARALGPRLNRPGPGPGSNAIGWVMRESRKDCTWFQVYQPLPAKPTRPGPGLALGPGLGPGGIPGGIPRY